MKFEERPLPGLGVTLTPFSYLHEHTDGDCSYYSSDWNTFISDCEQRAREDKNSHTGDYGFTHTNSFADALNLAKNGWPEGVERIASIERHLIHAIESQVKTTTAVLSENGLIFDVGEVLAGVPECWIDFEEQARKTMGFGRKMISIVINVGALGWIEADAKVNRGAAILAALSILEAHGYSTEIFAVRTCAPCFQPSKKFHCRVRVKSFTEALDLDRLAFALVHPSMQRRLIFALSEGLSAPYYQRFSDPSGYASSCEDPLSSDEADIYVGVIPDNSFLADSKANELVKTFLREYDLLMED